MDGGGGTIPGGIIPGGIIPGPDIAECGPSKIWRKNAFHYIQMYHYLSRYMYMFIDCTSNCISVINNSCTNYTMNNTLSN